VFNSIGQTTEADYSAGDAITLLDVSVLQTGFYIARIYTDSGIIYTARFQVIH
jgi:hypothetical protein